MGTVLITGGAGFLGSHLCDRFISRGDDVICIDNFISGSRANIKHLLDNSHFRLIEADVSLPLTTKLQNLTSIFHFASPASPNPDSPVSYINHPVETLMVNSIGTRNMLELAREHHCQIVLASTSEVYGDPEVHPQVESYWGHVSPNGQRSCYDEGKRFLEAISFAYFRTHGVKIKVARIFNTYGLRMRLDDGRFIPTIVNCAVNHMPFTQFGDGLASRSFCYVDDLVDGVLAMHDSSVVGEVINLGNPNEMSVTAAVNLLESISGKKLEIHQQPPLPDDPRRRQPDISKAKKLLGWEPKVSFESGLKSMLKFYS